jgi:hypothetical protein
VCFGIAFAQIISQLWVAGCECRPGETECQAWRFPVAPQGFYGTFVGYAFQFWVPMSMQPQFDAGVYRR